MRQWKRFCAWLLIPVMVLMLLPAANRAQAAQVSQEAYAEADLLFAKIDAIQAQPAKRNSTQTQLTDAAAEIVLESDCYVEGSLERKGDSFTWWTDDGIRCVYSPRLRKLETEMTPEAAQDAIVNEPKATRGGSADGNQVYVIGPYYGYDDSFTNQYKNEARRVAQAIGDTDGYTLYSGKAATVDKVADAVSNGAVVFFDSHGITDYERGYDYVTGATNSYLCLTSTTGLTDEDYNDGALYYSDGICINGATIANHMTKNSPGGILWMALCLGMATDTLCEPMRQMGVEVVYGYSQSVSFDGDYLFEETFWDEMTKGNTVADSIATMKSTWGNWDWSTKIAKYYGYYDGYATISAARKDYIAFPVVVSDEDAFPGQRTRTSYGACSLQEVKSTYQLNVVEDAPETPTEPEVPKVPDAPTASSATYIFEDYQVAGEAGGYEVFRELDETVSVYISSGWLTTQARIYKGEYMLIESARDMTSVVLNAGYKNSTFDVYLMDDAGNLTEYQMDVPYVASYSDITIELPEGCRAFLIDAPNAQVRLKYMTVNFAGEATQEPVVIGDVDGNENVDTGDAIYLLQHVLMPELFPIAQPADFDKNGTVNTDDAVYLLQHVLMPDIFPL